MMLKSQNLPGVFVRIITKPCFGGNIGNKQKLLEKISNDLLSNPSKFWSSFVVFQNLPFPRSQNTNKYSFMPVPLFGSVDTDPSICVTGYNSPRFVFYDTNLMGSSLNEENLVHRYHDTLRLLLLSQCAYNSIFPIQPPSKGNLEFDPISKVILKETMPNNIEIVQSTIDPNGMGLIAKTDISQGE